MSLLLALLLAQTSGFGYCPAGQVVQSIPRNAPIRCAAAGGSGAPTDATYWVSTGNGSLSSEVVLGSLATALVLNTGGTPSAYAGGTCTAPNFIRVISATGAVTCAAPTLSLSSLTAPTGDTSFTFPSGSKILWTFTGGADYAFSIHGDGAFGSSGDLVHLHLQGTGVTALADVLHIEWEDADATGLRLNGPAGSYAARVEGTARVLFGAGANAYLYGDGTGITSPGTITAPTFAGNASTASALAADPSDCGVGQAARGISANGAASGCFTPSGGGGGGGTFVYAPVDFGTGSDIASTVVTGQTWVTAASTIVCSPAMTLTTTRAEGAEDAVIEGLTVAVHSRVVGTGFTITAAPRNPPANGIFNVNCTAGDGTATGALGATIAPSEVSGLCVNVGACTATTDAAVCSGVNGSGSYTYSWAYLSGTTGTITSPAAASTTFSRTAGPAASLTGVFRCTVDDGTNTATATVTVVTDHEAF